MRKHDESAIPAKCAVAPRVAPAPSGSRKRKIDESAISAHAQRQHGLVSHRQAVAAGLSRTALSRRLSAGVWQVVRPRVFAAKVTATFEQGLMAACLWAGEGAVISHRSAALLWGLDVKAPAVELTVRRAKFGKAANVTVHRSDDLPEEDRRVRRGIPVTSAARTLIDLASCLEEEAMAFVLEEAWRKRIAAPDWVERRLLRLRGRGRGGARALAAMLDDCRQRESPLESPFEVRPWRLLRSSDVPLPVPGYEFRDDFGQPGRIDFAFPEQRLALEADSWEFHSGRESFEGDRLRTARLVALGWRVMPVTWRQLEDQPARVLTRLRSALEFRTEGPPADDDLW